MFEKIFQHSERDFLSKQKKTFSKTKNKSISRRLFLGLIIIAVIPICILGITNYYAAQEALGETAYSHMETIAKDHANHLVFWFAERSNDMKVLAGIPTIKTFCEHCWMNPDCRMSMPNQYFAANAILKLFGQRSDSYESIHILGINGDILATTDPNSEDALKFRQLPIYGKLLNATHPVVGMVHQHSDRSWRLHLGALVEGDRDLPVGLLLAVLDVSKTIEPLLLDRVGIGKTGEVYLVNNAGEIITKIRHPQYQELISKSITTKGVREALNKTAGTSVYRNYMKQEVIGSYLWLPEFGWGLLAEISKDEIMKPLKGIKVALFFTVALASFLCLALAFVFSRRVSRPLAQMANAVLKVSEGNLDQRVNYSGNDEISVLAECFNKMTKELSATITSLQNNERSLQTAYDDLVAAQEQLVQSEKMAAIGELVAGVVHEMRSPLSSIKLNVQIIGRTLHKEARIFKHYQIALDQIEQFERMFNDLLNYSKPITLDKKSVAVNTMIDKYLVTMHDELEERRIEIRKIIGSERSEILVDVNKIEQVFLNIIKNSADAIGEQGIIRIEAITHTSEEDNSVEIQISDNGPGIPQKNLDRVFQPFFTTKKKGTGLGLAMVKKIMEAHNADVIISSEKETGTIVKLKFPSREVSNGKDINS